MCGIIEKPRYEVVGELEKLDEADNVQARGELIPHTELWLEYYRKHPELEKQGNAWLKLPGMGNVGAPADLMMLGSLFSTIGMISKDEDLDGEPASERIEFTPERAAEKIKGFARLLGAELVGIGPLNQAWVYSHVGRAHYPGKVIGPEIHLPHRNAIVVAIHLNRNMIRTAPELSEMLEVIKTYLRLATIVVALAKYIRSLGYPARAHDIANYQVLLVPIAIDAGLGELGRNGVMITEKYGNMVKMAAVTTDLPIKHDKPVNIGVEEYCQQCTVCARYCPSGAIPLKKEKQVIRGVRKWKVNDAACYTYFRTVGTDCGICMAVCPWSRPRHFPHNLILKGVESSALIRKMAASIDNKLARKRAESPNWLEKPDMTWQVALRKGHPFRK